MLSEATDQKPARAQKNPMSTNQQPKVSESLPCPRCESTSTKFCYYNNYNLSQPRYFCKSCRRYWTHGGTLRNIPIGGGTRKNSRRNRTGTGACSAANSSSCSSTVTHERMGGPHAVPASSEIAATDVNLNASVNVPGSGSFTSMLNMQQIQGQNFLGLGGFHGYGIGSSLEELELGFGGTTPPPPPRSWEIPGADSASGCNTWQLMNGDDQGVNDGGEDCFGWSGLAISTPAMKGLK